MSDEKIAALQRGAGHGPITPATIELHDDTIEAEQCKQCGLEVPLEGAGSDGFETHRCGLVQRYLAPKLLTKEDREESA